MLDRQFLLSPLQVLRWSLASLLSFPEAPKTPLSRFAVWPDGGQSSALISVSLVRCKYGAQRGNLAIKTNESRELCSVVLAGGGCAGPRARAAREADTTTADTERHQRQRSPPNRTVATTAATASYTDPIADAHYSAEGAGSDK
jgi:hypothetical protein